MKNVKRISMFLMAALALAFAACTEEYMSTDAPETENGLYTLSMPLDELEILDEETGEPLSRSYFTETLSGWTFNWENGDKIYYYSMRNGAVNQQGYAEIKKTSSRTYIEFLSAKPFAKGDVIYSYLCQDPEKEPATTPKAVVLEIPAEQFSDWGADQYVDTYKEVIPHEHQETTTETKTEAVNFSHTLTEKTLSNKTKTPSTLSLSVTLSSYDASNTYTYSIDNGQTYKPLTVDKNNSANIAITFSEMKFTDSWSGWLFWGSTTTTGTDSKTLCIKCNDGNPATLVINVTGKKSGSSYNYTYTAGKYQSGSYEHEVVTTHTTVDYETTYRNDTTYSKTKILPVRNAMPIVSAPLTVTSSMANGNTSVAGSLEYKMIGSLIEFRFYTKDAAIAKGETIQYVTFTATKETQIAGEATHNLTSSNYLNLTGVKGSSSVVSHVENCGYVISDNKNDYVPVRMVVAPGTYASTLEVVTDKYRYTYNVSSMTYSKAVRKALTTNLSSFTRSSLATPTTYSVSTSLTECSFAELLPDAVNVGEPFTATLIPNEGYALENVVITMGGEDVTDQVYVDGVITIENVTGDLVITATAAYVPKVFTFTADLENCQLGCTVPETITEGTSFSTTLTANEGYTLSEVKVLLANEDVTEFAWSEGTITIPYVSGDLFITAVATENYIPKTFGVTFNAPEYITITGAAAATEGEDYTATVTLAEGYENLAVTVTMDGKSVEGAFAEGTVKVAAVAGDIVITATATKIPTLFSVKFDQGEGTVITGAETATEGKEYTAKVALAEGYENLAVTVAMAGQPVEGVFANGTVTLKEVTGDIVIKATATKIYVPATFGVKFEAPEYITIKGDAAATEGQDYTATVTLAEGYENLAVNVTMDGKPVTGAFADGMVKIAAVTGNIVITATATKIPATFKVDLKANEGTTITGAETATEGKTYTANVALKEGYVNLVVTVTMDGKTLTGVYKDGVVNIANVTGDIVVAASATRIPSNFKVTFDKGEGTAITGAETATEGKEYTAKVTLIEGYENLAVTVTMGGKEVNAFANGTITLKEVTGDIVIKATATKIYVPATFGVKFETPEYITIKGDAAATEGQDYTATVTLAEGYENLAVTVTMDGKPVAGAYANGLVKIAAVTGNIVITATASKIPATFKVDLKANEGTTITGAETATEGKAYTANVALKEGYVNLVVTVTMGGKTLTGAYKDGVVNIANVTGDIVVAASATKVPTTFKVTFNKGEGTTIAGEEAATEGKTYTANVALLEGYENLVVTVSMGGKTVEGAFANGTVSIKEVTGDIVIAATATKTATEAKIFTVTVNRDSSKTRFSGAKEATEGEAYSATTRAIGDYALDVVTVTMGGQDISATAYADGKINIAKVTGDIVITVTVKYHPSSYSVEVNTWHVNYEGDYTAESDKPFYATLTPEPGYELSKVVVTMGGYSLNGTYYNDGIIDIPAVNGTIIIEAEAKLIPAPVWETAYAVFCSDRHSNTTAFSSTFNGVSSTLKNAVTYVCQNGDMVGSGGSDHPAYNSSTIQSEVRNIFPNAKVNINYGSHDASVTDNAGIVTGKTAGSSGLAYTQYDSKGNVQYYVYNIAYDDMATDSNGQTSSATFKSWVSTITDKSIPIIVACHMPLHSGRGDNQGAYYWNRALTYAATGSETGKTVTRNVIFFHGHNHTTESNREYYYAPGSSLSIAQGKGSVSSTIPYTYITGGYQNANKKATLVTVEAETITFTKYTNGSASTLGTVARVK